MLKLKRYDINNGYNYFKFKTDGEIKAKIMDNIYYLRTHNKNYTREQEVKIMELEDIFKHLEG